MPGMEDMMKQLEEVLEDGRGTGMPIVDALALGPGVQISTLSGELLFERERSPIKARLEALVDGLLGDVQITNGYKRELRQMVMVYYSFGMSTEMVLSPLTALQEALEKNKNLSDLEKGELIEHVRASLTLHEMRDQALHYQQWCQDWLDVYGEDEEIHAIREWMRRLVERKG